MVKTKGLVVLLAILFISIFLGYFLIRVNPNYPVPGKIQEKQISENGQSIQLDWINYESPAKNFKVKFPTLPQRSAKTFADPQTKSKRNYEVYISNGKDGSAYMINIINFEELKTNISDDEILAEVANDMMTNHPNNKLIKSESGKFLGHPSLKFSLESDKVEIDTLTFVNGKTLYVLTRIASSGDSDKKEFNYFIESFELASRS